MRQKFFIDIYRWPIYNEYKIYRSSIYDFIGIVKLFVMRCYVAIDSAGHWSIVVRIKVIIIMKGMVYYGN